MVLQFSLCIMLMQCEYVNYFSICLLFHVRYFYLDGDKKEVEKMGGDQKIAC